MKKTFQQRLDEKPHALQKAIDNTIKSEKKYRSRIKKRTEQILTHSYVYFMTYTLNDEALQTTTEKQHIKKIKATLPEATLYMINNDYGTQTDRLHYHALVSFDYEYDTTFMTKYQYGYTKIKRIITYDTKSIYEYLMKLSNHATKKAVAKIWRSKKIRSTHIKYEEKIIL
jgi:hypothetical protein